MNQGDAPDRFGQRHLFIFSGCPPAPLGGAFRQEGRSFSRFSFSPSGAGFYHVAVNARSFFSIFPKVFSAGRLPEGKIDLKEKQHRYF
ncbi:MAG: hypothetical protein J6Y21_07305 [Clostridia bacterium]|nr:hypothetical protein [Clostridia bacterium]